MGNINAFTFSNCLFMVIVTTKTCFDSYSYMDIIHVVVQKFPNPNKDESVIKEFVNFATTSSNRVPVSSLLAVRVVHHHLVSKLE